MSNHGETNGDPDFLVEEFASRGLVILQPDELGISPQVHADVYAQEKRAYHAQERVTPANVPAVLDVLNAPGLVAACDRLVGKNWAIVPFTHNASFTSGPRDQHWHKDDNGPYNSRKQRHHQAVQIEMLYYPQLVTEQMGPTATIPYSQYWTFNHEENHDNFAGADHLDFDYVLTGMEREPVSGPDSKYDGGDILHGRTAHDLRMREAVTKTGWPLVKQFVPAPLQPGTIILYSHNTFHRGNHRRDDWRTWQENPRFMWRFWLYRTTDADPATENVNGSSWSIPAADPLTGIDLNDVGEDLTSVWRYHTHWIKTGQAPSPRPESVAQSPAQQQAEVDELVAQLHAKYDAAEPARIGAAYRLASISDTKLAVSLLGQALFDERESVRRAATYGLIAVGSDATETLLHAASAPMKWVRKAATYGLGDASPLTAEVRRTLVTRLLDDPSVYIRSVAAGSLGCLGRRAIATGVGIDLVPDCAHVLLTSLEQEENRLAMSKAQGRSIKFVRPTDDCDVCEGDGVDFGLERFQPVRSAVRENVLWSLVILCSHGPTVLGDALEPTIETLKQIVKEEENVICVGYAMDALARLAKINVGNAESSSVGTALNDELLDILGQSPTQCWEALVRSGLGSETVAQIG